MRNVVNRVFVLVCGVLVVLSLAACGGSPSASNGAAPTTAPGEATSAGDQGGVTVTNVTLKRDNGSGAAGDTVDKFTPADHKQYFEADLSGTLAPGAKVHWVFTAVDTSAGKDVKVVETDVDVLVGNHLSANVSLPNDWPTGKYRADISINGKLVKSVDYTVGAAG